MTDDTKKPAASDLSAAICSAFDRVDSYHLECSKAYGPMPTEYHKGKLHGLECARALIAHERDKQNVEDSRP
jgi:hypothetical protein